ncbi:uncharacterized protein A1O5_04499 [Cladophialophora psammophila CBS 110553]|uniref:Uncharacterized protein n=1 Tax=Cladophialophora psammophila CBS 110553 TaxID=1182543 RepID=W9X500_9EURO|nr:uncharacterized protein A1O5_04499 [Cladophialophora psammophila CBS 110553]EXJ71996.1 hypothetical protein A1O5_04499 [Cladophialophora psammophila CBS 110553]
MSCGLIHLDPSKFPPPCEFAPRALACRPAAPELGSVLVLQGVAAVRQHQHGVRAAVLLRRRHLSAAPATPTHWGISSSSARRATTSRSNMTFSSRFRSMASKR